MRLQGRQQPDGSEVDGCQQQGCCIARRAACQRDDHGASGQNDGVYAQARVCGMHHQADQRAAQHHGAGQARQRGAVQQGRDTAKAHQRQAHQQALAAPHHAHAERGLGDANRRSGGADDDGDPDQRPRGDALHR
ncbi:hypothetical protein DBR42_29635, partial [Pelomonas sp. HMWF004]